MRYLRNRKLPNQTSISGSLTVNRTKCRVDLGGNCRDVFGTVPFIGRGWRKTSLLGGDMEQPIHSELRVQRRDIDSGDAITADELIIDSDSGGDDQVALPELASIPVEDTNIRYTKLFWTVGGEVRNEESVTVANSRGLTAICWYRRLNGGISEAGVLDVYGIEPDAAISVGHVLEGSELSISEGSGSEARCRRFQTEPVGVTVRARRQLTAHRVSLRFDHWHVIGDASGLHINEVTLDAEPGVSALAIAVYKVTERASQGHRDVESGDVSGVGATQHHGLGAWIAGRLRGSRQTLGDRE